MNDESLDATVVVDGAVGGGQILRSSLSLSAITGRPLEITAIRAKRKKRGLLAQHLCAVRAAAQLCSAQVEGAELGSTELQFRPGPVHGTHLDLRIGTAGSTGLVAQTALPIGWSSDAPTQIALSGGTHNRSAPPFEFLAESYGEAVRRMGVSIDFSLERVGLEPQGGGRLVVQSRRSEPQPIDWTMTCDPEPIAAKILSAGLPGHVAEREADALQRKLGVRAEVIECDGAPANLILLAISSPVSPQWIVEYGRPGLPAERVAQNTVRAARNLIRSRCPVSEELADQLLLPCALAGTGAFRTPRATAHTTSNGTLIERFLPVRIDFTADDGSTLVRVSPRED